MPCPKPQDPDVWSCRGRDREAASVVLKAEVEKARNSLGAESGSFFKAPSHFGRAELHAWNKCWMPGRLCQHQPGSHRLWAGPLACSVLRGDWLPSPANPGPRFWLLADMVDPGITISTCFHGARGFRFSRMGLGSSPGPC